MEAQYTIKHASYTAPGTDADGYPIPEGHGAAVDRQVFGWYPQSSQAGAGASTVVTGDEYAQRIITNKIVMVPDVTIYTPGDLIAFPGDDITDDESAYRVSRDVQDFNTGPFGYKPGGAIVVERVRG